MLDAVTRNDQTPRTTGGRHVTTMHLPRLQGGGPVKYKPVERKRPHHPSSIELPAVYQTWKAPSRRRKAQASESRLTSRSVPALRRDSDEASGPNRAVNSAPTSKTRPSNHDRHPNQSVAKNHTTPPRLPKINSLVSAVESQSPAGLPTTKHSSPKEVNKKTSPATVEPRPSNPPPHRDEKKPRVPKSETAHQQSSGKESVTSPKTRQITKAIVTKEVDNSRGDAENNNAAVKERKSDKNDQNLPKNHQESNNNEKVTQPVEVKSKVQSRTEKKVGTTNDVRKEKLHDVTKTPPNRTENSKQRTFTKARTEPSFLKRDLDNAAKGSSVSHTKVTSTQKNTPRSKSDLTKPKPPLVRKSTKTGYFTSSGEFVTDDDGRYSDISAVTATTKSVVSKRTTATVKSRASQSSTASLSSKTSTQSIRKPLRRRPVIITKKTLSQQKFFNSVYNNRNFKLQRQVKFLKKVEDAQRKVGDEKTRSAINKDKKFKESMTRQRTDLKRIRDRFDEDQVKRFSRQYMSWRSVETDRLKRSSIAYGLPDHIYEDRYDRTLKDLPKNPKSAKEKPAKKLSRYVRWVRNIKKFELLLKPKAAGTGLERSMLQNADGALIEGIDTVELQKSFDDKGKKPKQVKVRTVIGSAKRLLQVTQDMDAISEVSHEDDDDDEYARLGIQNFDIDDDDVSSLDLSDDDEEE